jgi:hypothetical protein
MTFSPRPRSNVAKLTTAGQFALAFVLVGLVSVSSGCEDKHIGRVCALDTAPDAGTTATGSTATLNGQAIECPSRICLLPAASGGVNTMGTGPLCTATCSSDDDCSDGETTNSGTSAQCKTGFTCIVATTVGDFCCQRMCACKDFIDTSVKDYNKTPTVCQPHMGGMCKNVAN